MPNRYLREGILTSDRVNRLGLQAELFYRRLMSLVDDFGRFEASPSLLRAAAFPLRVDVVREADITRWLTEVQSAGLIVLYAVNDKNYLELLGLGEPRAKSSKYPGPLSSANRRAQTKTSAPSSITPSITIPITKNAPAAQASAEVALRPSTAAPDPVVMEFPCVPSKNSAEKVFLLRESVVAQWRETFPGIDVLGVCRKALEWLRSHPKHLKTHGRMRAWISGVWLGKEQDHARPTGVSHGQPRNQDTGFNLDLPDVGPARSRVSASAGGENGTGKSAPV